MLPHLRNASAFLALALFVVTPMLHAEPKFDGYVFSVTVNSPQQLDVVLSRAEDLRELFDPDQHGRIVIVLHGDELQLFQKQNYSSNQSVVDRARLLDEDNIIDINETFFDLDKRLVLFKAYCTVSGRS